MHDTKCPLNYMHWDNCNKLCQVFQPVKAFQSLHISHANPNAWSISWHAHYAKSSMLVRPPPHFTHILRIQDLKYPSSQYQKWRKSSIMSTILTLDNQTVNNSMLMLKEQIYKQTNSNILKHESFYIAKLCTLHPNGIKVLE